MPPSANNLLPRLVAPRTLVPGARVLIACRRFEEFAGAEVTCIDLARLFASWGALPTIAAKHIADPILEHARGLGLDVTDISSLARVRNTGFDLIWVHHAEAYYALVDAGIEAVRTVVSCLSPFEPRETPPITIGGVNVVLANSEETRERLVGALKLPQNRVDLLLNSAPFQFFASGTEPQRLPLPQGLRIGVISNHPVEELAALREYVDASGGSLEFIGRSARVQPVTPALLRGFDLIVTIGRTVQYCMAARVPVFVYDHFGGPGWITHENLDRAEQYNFSGRCTGNRRTADELWDELRRGLPRTCDRVDELHQIACDRYRLDANVARIVDELDATLAKSFRIDATNEMLLAHAGLVAGLQQEIDRLHAEGQAREVDRLAAWDNVARLTAAQASAPTLDSIANTISALSDRFGQIYVDFRASEDDRREAWRNVAGLQASLASARQEAARFEAELVAKTAQALTQQAAHGEAARVWAAEEARIRLALDQSKVDLRERTRQLDALTVQVLSLETRLRSAEGWLAGMRGSWSWRLTAPLRSVRAGVSATRRWIRASGSDGARWLYRRAPVSGGTREALKKFAFTRLGWILSGTLAYKDWLHQQQLRTSSAFSPRPQSDADGRAGWAPKRDRQRVMPSVERPPATLASVYQRSEAELDHYRIEAMPLQTASLRSAPAVRSVAFYLPQFHPIPENDAWWGRGFTEWTNVVRGEPQFVGHYQPRLPGELGFYDLRVPEVQRRQVELARLYGVGAFCFYFYWFGGKRLLEAPIGQYLEHAEFDLPFCLCWANENWSRRWDGMDQELLIAQNHSPQDDLAFIEHVGQYLRDSRYLRVDGRPLLLVYRPGLLPEPKVTAECWRAWCRQNGIGEIVLAYTQSFEAVDPSVYGFDLAIEFPPNNSAAPVITDQVEPLNPDYAGIVYDWRVFPERSRNYGPPAYPLWRAVCPSWDNEARRRGRGAVFLHSTPEAYREWLANAARDTVARFPNPDHRLVFINAWNEWAEGAHLEPDQRYGYAHLQATRDGLADALPRRRYRILLVCHDAHPHGAQYLALNMARSLKDDLGIEVDLVLLGDGPMRPRFETEATVHYLGERPPDDPRSRELFQRLREDGVLWAICNTAVSGAVVGMLKTAGIATVSLIHELPGVIRRHKLEGAVQEVARHADAVVFPARTVQQGFSQFASLDADRVRIRPQGLYKHNRYRGAAGRAEARAGLRSALSLPRDCAVVLGVGYADHRKGVDLFVEIAAKVTVVLPGTRFVWVGHFDLTIEKDVRARVAALGLGASVIFAGLQESTDVYYAGADVFALTSREDPFPSVVLESMDVGLPVVGFAGAGGFTELLDNGCGASVAFCDVDAFACELLDLLRNPTRHGEIERMQADLISREFSFRSYLFDLLSFVGHPIRKVSVVVPNFNYKHLIDGRLNSIETQTYPIHELIVLDDASTDGSAEYLGQRLARCRIPVRFVENTVNSGSVFLQWRKGVELATGEFIWIAEADDLAEPAFLASAMLAFAEDDVVMSYCESKQMDAEGRVLCEHYRDYVADISAGRWLSPYCVDGSQEIREALAVKNTIPNVSAVVFRRAAVAAALEHCVEDLLQLRTAGDWLTYVNVLRSGRIAFTPESLNLHRRHVDSVTLSGFDLRHLREIVAMQRRIADAFDVDPVIRDAARNYAQRLYEQFGLKSASYPSFELHPDLSGRLAA